MANNPRNPQRDGADDPPAQSDETAPNNEKGDFKRPSFYVNVLTLIVIGVYTCFACNQVQKTQTANDIAKKALTEANKPYVMWTGFNPHYTLDSSGGRHFRVGINWTNLGNTPATYVRTYNCDPIVRDDVVEPAFHCNISENKDNIPESVIGPKQLISTVGPIIKESDFQATRDEKKAIYIFGYVTYQDAIDTDAYGNPEQRETRFCQRIVQPTLVQNSTNPADNASNSAPTFKVIDPPPGAPITALGTFGCRSFSCMDKECRPIN